MPPDDAAIAVEALRASVGARAAGLWSVEGGRLVRRAFAAAPDLDRSVAARFADATESVPADRVDLGIVAAATLREVFVSVAAELPADSGSGYWLRAFGAGRSVAVPLLDAAGEVAAVASVALATDDRTDDSIADAIRAGIPVG